MSHRVTLIKGDGIGPEITEATCQVIAAAGVKIQWEKVFAGRKALEKSDSPLPKETIQSLLSNRVGLKGPLETPIAEGFPSVNVLLRKELDLYVNLRPIESFPGIRSRYRDINLVVIRENTEGLYSGVEKVISPDRVEAIKVITKKASTRISEFAFQYAQKESRKKITVVHKANIMKLSDGLFLKCAREVSQKFPEIEYQEMIIDNTCMQLVLKPEQFDVLLMENLYGDIISDLAAGLVGGLGLVPSANIGKKVAIFEAVHGTAPDIAGQNKANPVALILSGTLMLDYLGESEAANKIRNGVRSVLLEGGCLTPDLGGVATTADITKKIIASMS